MTDFQNVAVQVGALAEKTLFGGSAGVAGKEHAKGAVAQHERDGVLVDVVCASSR